MTTYTQLLDRIHAINQTFSTVNAYRYWYELRSDPAKLPGVCPIPGAGSRNNTQTSQQRALITRTIQIELVGGHWLEGDKGVSAQKAIEPAIDEIEREYMERTQLELSGSPLAGVSQSQYVSNTGIQFRDSLAIVRFTLNIATWQTVNTGAN